METLHLNFSALGGLSDDELFQLCISNKQLRIERSAKGEILIMAPAGSSSSMTNADIVYYLKAWNKKQRLGRVFESSAGFTLPNGAMRSPDAAFILQERWEAVSAEDRKRFAPICPDFVVELMSHSDALKTAQDKMHEWMDNGCRLAWLINPKQQKVYIYRADGDVSVVETFEATLSGEDVLPEFTLDLREIEW
jgi:Uma2 family endonuclease